MLSKENERFQYRTVENYVVIESCKEDFSMVDFPEQIEGIAVTELAGYVLSQKACEEVHIPAGIRKIGKYGFYNCRNLRKISFSSDLLDIGSGAFTGCHHIREIEVLMKSEKTALREVLTEVSEELCVTLIWEEACTGNEKKAVLWFPEFFEESIENTPARILSVQTHGSGMFYRNCFKGKKFQFAEYDKRFETACALESEKFLMELVAGRLMYPVELGEKAKKTYEIFLSKHKEKMIKYWIDEKKDDSIEWILTNYPYTKDERLDFQEIMSYASSKENPALISYLMDYGRKIFPAKRKSFEL